MRKIRIELCGIPVHEEPFPFKSIRTNSSFILMMR